MNQLSITLLQESFKRIRTENTWCQQQLRTVADCGNRYCALGALMFEAFEFVDEADASIGDIDAWYNASMEERSYAYDEARSALNYTAARQYGLDLVEVNDTLGYDAIRNVYMITIGEWYMKDM